MQRWRQTGEVPAPVMVWTAAQCGSFLDSTEASDDPPRPPERLYALFHLAAYSGMRRSELAGLAWADVDLDRCRVNVRQARSMTRSTPPRARSLTARCQSTPAP